MIMKKTLFAMLFALTGLICLAQQPAEQMPTFKGGDLKTFREWVTSKVKCPKGPGGMALVIFTVKSDGSVKLDEIRNSPGDAYDDALRSVFAQCPAWEPGWQLDKETGERVRKSIRLTMPVKFVPNE